MTLQGYAYKAVCHSPCLGVFCVHTLVCPQITVVCLGTCRPRGNCGFGCVPVCVGVATLQASVLETPCVCVFLCVCVCVRV